MPFDFLGPGDPVAIVLDLETTVQPMDDKTDNTPFHPRNKCVSAHWLMLDDLLRPGPVSTRVWHHAEKAVPDDRVALQEALDSVDLLIAHNAKFDVIWLLEMGYRIPARVYCTMIGEYIYARGQFDSLSLKATAERRNVTRKKSDLVDDLFKSGIGFERMPLDTVIEYAEADVQSCAEIYLAQQDDLCHDRNKGLKPVFDLMNDMLLFLVDIERNGICIDLEALEQVGREFEAEKAQIEKRLHEIVQTVMGDTPINLASGRDMTKVVYSRTLIDPKLHKQMFNCGVGANGKPLPVPRMKPKEFAAAVRATTVVTRKTVVHCCPDCAGSGKQSRFTKSGEPYKKQPNCKTCDGAGVVYISTGETAGLKLSPEGPRDASANGFKTDKDSIAKLIGQAIDKGNDLAVEFLEKIRRLNAVSSYISTFVGGMARWRRATGILHPNFNQCVAKTGRLSANDPNFQNFPKGGKFPIRRAVVSRFKGGLILEADFSGLEFVVAGELSGDIQIISDILNGKDIHKQTASIILQKLVEMVTKDERQGAKPYTFAPLYGGMGANEAAHIRKYFEEFFVIYPGLKAYHGRLMDGVLKDGIVRVPSGREYIFPNAKRTRNGQVTGATMIKNYPIQGFATGDIVPLACVRARRAFKERGLQSLLILTVHDSIVVDVYPGELDQVVEALTWAMPGVVDELQSRFNYTMKLPLRFEMEAGESWLAMKPVHAPAPEKIAA